MECKQWLLLVAALCLGSACSQNRKHPPYACQCLMDVQARKRCDSTSAGITAEQCTEKGCCFDATVPDVPWCFKPSGERASLRYAKRMIEQQARVDCGYQGITRKRCKRIGCCFDRKASDTSMCFYPPVNEVSQHCVMDMSAREECGYPGITAEECQGRGCCFNSYVVSTRWCFYPASITGPPKMCGMAPNKRVGCGYPGISADECLRKGCCFEHYQYAQNVPWCFEPLASFLKWLPCEAVQMFGMLTNVSSERNADVTLIPKRELTVDLLESLPSNAGMPGAASVLKLQECPGALLQAPHTDSPVLQMPGVAEVVAEVAEVAVGAEDKKATVMYLLVGEVTVDGLEYLECLALLSFDRLLFFIELSGTHSGLKIWRTFRGKMNFKLLWLLATFLVLGFASFTDGQRGGQVNNGGKGGQVDNGGNGGQVDNGGNGGQVDNGGKGGQVDYGGNGQQTRGCNVPPSRRRECGWAGITRHACLRRGCCFNNAVKHTRWCFHRN
nr:uncharacterized protein LOC118085727 [Zootoca vivipara]